MTINNKDAQRKSNKVKIAEIYLEYDASGDSILYSADFVGSHAAQGGMEFGWGNVASDNLRSLFTYIKNKVKKDEREIIKDHLTSSPS